MLIVNSKGRLGNNIFQYAFARFVANKDETIIAVGMKEYIDVFGKLKNVSSFLSADNKFTKSIMRRLLHAAIMCCVKVRLISLYSDSDTGSYTHSKGFISGLTYVSGYFQNPSFLSNETFSSLLPKAEHIDQAKKKLQASKTKKNVFVHIRRGDLVTSESNEAFLIYGKPVLLPAEYYKKIIQQISATEEKVAFVFISDAPHYVEEHFSEVSNKIIVSGSMEIDFVVASMCDGGIASASTFSFWTSMIAMHVNGASLPFYAPTYWLGHGSGTWYPPSMKSPDLTYIDV